MAADSSADRNRPPWAWIPASTILLVLFALSTTSWIARIEARAIVEPPEALSALLMDIGARDAETTARPPAWAVRRREEIVRSRPDDYAIQLANALNSGDAAEVLGNLRALVQRFPTRPELRAHILRYACMRQVHIRRDEESLLSGTTPTPPTFPYTPPTRQDLEAFERDAADGERLDPQNAFFPLIRAIGLTAAHRDSEAIAALKQAGEKPKLDDYIADEVRSRWRLSELVHGRQSALQRVVVSASTLFPHFAQMRALARFATYRAVEAEHAGRLAEGLAIRNALLRCSERLRAQSAATVGSLVGIAITQIALVRPGGGLRQWAFPRAWLHSACSCRWATGSLWPAPPARRHTSRPH